jgi:hypothetical protein
VGNPASRPDAVDALQRLGFGCSETDDPYAAMSELCRRPLVYRALILSVASLYREELNLIAAVKRRFPHVEIWLTHTDGRQASLAEAMRLGADGLLAEDGLHRIALPATAGPGMQALPGISSGGSGTNGGSAASGSSISGLGQQSMNVPAPLEAPRPAEPRPVDADTSLGEPVLTADELRALLQEQTAPPPQEP